MPGNIPTGIEKNRSIGFTNRLLSKAFPHITTEKILKFSGDFDFKINFCWKQVGYLSKISYFGRGLSIHLIMSEFQGKCAILTGAGQGIGKEIARQLALQGAHLILNDLDADLLETTVEEMNEHHVSGGGRCIGVPGDAGDLTVIDEMIHQATLHFNRLDMVVANAGITTFGDFLEYQADDFEKLMHLNLQGSFFLCQKSARAMIHRGIKGRIILMSSVTGHQAHEGLTAYGMTKAALQALAKLTAVELASYGITVNAISPGATITERTLEDPDYIPEWERITPTGVVTRVEDIAHTALFLLSEKTGQLTGQTLIVDGGWTSTSPQPKEK